jgi:hypothetical protein
MAGGGGLDVAAKPWLAISGQTHVIVKQFEEAMGH